MLLYKCVYNIAAITYSIWQISSPYIWLKLTRSYHVKRVTDNNHIIIYVTCSEWFIAYNNVAYTNVA